MKIQDCAAIADPIVNVTNPVDYTTPVGRAYLDEVHANKSVYWTAPGLKITRLRMLTDRNFPYLDVSYCHGEIDGKPVRVDLPFGQLNKRLWMTEIVNYAKADRVYAKGIGILDRENISVQVG